eukprot:TRINITY_DN5787_c0_g3_i1.p1 TRINITY_DN5787_c0_g3~~TRINITY_DN5787_c0_g3_i1.p1  ORF type:complete len:872 (+),score=120.54 TRINITY_DN5787_c0_g3_i1:34-2616(+)
MRCQFLARAISLRTIFLGVLLGCVVVSTAVAWAVNLRQSVTNTEELSLDRQRAVARRNAEFVSSAFTDPNNFANYELRWLQYLGLPEGFTFPTEWIWSEALPRQLRVQILECSVTSMLFMTADLRGIASTRVRNSTTSDWVLKGAYANQSAITHMEVWKFPAARPEPLYELPSPTIPLDWITATKDRNLTYGLVFVEATSEPYFGVSFRFRATASDLSPYAYVFFGCRTNEFAQYLLGQVTGSERLYVVDVEDDNTRIGTMRQGILLSASHGPVAKYSAGVPKALLPEESADPFVKASAIRLLALASNSWDKVPSYQRTPVNGEDCYVLTERVTVGTARFVVVDVTPTDQVLGRIKKGNRITAILCALILAATIAVGLVLTILLVRELEWTSHKMVELSALEFHSLDHRRPRVIELQKMHDALQKLHSGIQDFSKYVPIDVVRALLANADICPSPGVPSPASALPMAKNAFEHLPEGYRESSGDVILPLEHTRHKEKSKIKGKHRKNESRSLGLPQMEKRELSVMFADIESFTSLCEAVPSDILYPVLSEYFDAMSRAIMQHNGTIDKYIGDCIMAMWNAPQPVPDHRRQALIACVSMMARLRQLHHMWEAGVCEGLPSHCDATESPPVAMETPAAVASGSSSRAGTTSTPALPLLRFRLGLNTGEVLVGSFGSKARLAYTCVGDSVNLAARLEAFNKETGTRMLVTNTTLEGSETAFITRPMGSARVIGKAVPVPVYELLCLAPEEKHHDSASEDLYMANFLCADGSSRLVRSEEARRLAEQHGLAVQHAQARRFQQCLDTLHQMHVASIGPSPGSPASALERAGAPDAAMIKLREWAQEALKNPPPHTWDGVFTQNHK